MDCIALRIVHMPGYLHKTMRRKEAQEQTMFEGFDPVKVKRRTRYSQKTIRKKQQVRKSWKQQRGERSETDYDSWSERE